MSLPESGIPGVSVAFFTRRGLPWFYCFDTATSERLGDGGHTMTESRKSTRNAIRRRNRANKSQ